MAKKKLTLEDMLVPVDEIPYEVPENWCWTRLKFIIDKINYGYTESASMDNIGPKFLRITDIKENGVDWNSVPYCIIDEKNYEKYKLNKGDIVVARTGATTGKNHIIEEEIDAVFASYLIRFTLNKDINRKYISYFMKTQDYWNQIMEERKGIAQPGVNAQKLSNIIIPLPPLAEQERIVNRIESLFDKVDRAAELVDEARDGFEKRRAAILEMAFSGQLTKKWREENGVSDVDTVIESILTKRLTMIEDKIIKKDKLNNNISESEIVYDIPKDWRWIRLGILCRFIDYRGKTPSKTSSGVRLITAKNIKKGYISFEPEEFIAEEDYEGWMTRGIPNYGDVIFTTEAPLGNVAQLNIQGKYALAQRAITLPIIDGAYPEYLKYILMSQSMQKVINEQSTGTTVKGIKASKLKEIIIPLPSMKEQKEIIRILDSTLNNETKIEEVSNICEYIDVIKKSILAKAFRGELGSNDLNEESSIGLIKDMLNS